ncbi:alkaline phosphatase PhoX [Desertimonas flava]|uniref:alkaline phosphatase PhoX n=1 Tax=Desertimonas flava TaxID=2064846 RepID=UPI000E34688E|nr:alkaline phosphatase PhoX [Desertimonas flava]
MPLNRRQLLNRGAAGAGLLVAGNLGVTFPRAGATAGTPGGSALGGAVLGTLRERRGGYGPLVADPDQLLDLPEGFSYTIVSEAGTATTDGGVIPDNFDGTGLFVGANGNSYLVRNSEQGAIEGVDDGEPYVLEFPATAAAEYVYDATCGGGTTTTEIGPDGSVVNEYVSLAGTSENCAGGVTPWGTWLTCEETEDRIADGFEKDHGFVFEVDPVNVENNQNPTPLEGLGRFAHEAVSIDPATGIVYLTEDASEPNGLLYRATPNDTSGTYGSLRAGATLEALAATDEAGEFVPDLSAYSEVGTVLNLGWVAIPDPLATEQSTRMQVEEVTRSRKLEGTWWGNDAAYIVASYARLDDGSAGEHDGQVWKLDPVAETLELVVHFTVNADPDSDNFDSPDNITVAPWGGLILCADGEGVQHLWTVAADGSNQMFARNARDDGEFAGAVFSADGQTLYASLQSPGVTFAITGPWDGGTPASTMAADGSPATTA